MSEQLNVLVEEMTYKARAAARVLATATTEKKNLALNTAARLLKERTAEIASANEKDLAAGRKMQLPAAMLDRLEITGKRMDSMVAGLKQVAELPDPVGRQLSTSTRPNGLVVTRVSVPIGTIFIIFESRPNVTVDAAALTLKSGNAVILRGGKEAINTNRVLADILRDSAEKAGLPADAIQMAPVIDRALVSLMLKRNDRIDLVIPRGGEGLIHTVVEQSTIAVIKHYRGVCHVYVDKAADLDMAGKIAFNAKVQRPGVCNAMETLLVHADAADKFLPDICDRLSEAGVEIRGDERVQRLFGKAKAATEDDWRAEYLDLVLAVRVVDSLDAALEHIEKYGSRHTDAIVSSDPEALERFRREVDSACVHINASTRFSDGFEYGLGAEIGISTDKLHARGPMGLDELTIYKFIVEGKGQVRE